MGIGSSEGNSEGVIPPPETDPHQDLAQGEVDAFLEYLFSDVARRPRPLSLERGAAVVRYLDALAWETEPGDVRQLLGYLRDVIWGTLRLFAPFDLSSKQEAIAFLEQHADTYLADLNVAAALAHLRDSAPPTRYRALFRPLRLISRNLSGAGLGDPRLREDLTERIYAGYHALRKARVRNARGRLAAALNKQGLQTRAHSRTSRQWGGYEVYERVKQCEARWKRQNTGGQRTPEEWRESVVYKWVHLFHSQVGDPRNGLAELCKVGRGE